MTWRDRFIFELTVAQRKDAAAILNQFEHEIAVLAEYEREQLLEKAQDIIAEKYCR